MARPRPCSTKCTSTSPTLLCIPARYDGGPTCNRSAQPQLGHRRDPEGQQHRADLIAEPGPGQDGRDAGEHAGRPSVAYACPQPKG